MAVIAKLDKKSRDALPDDHFAVPGKRKLPIHDEKHTRLAWDQVGRTQDLTDEERKTARERILCRAADLGVNTKDWLVRPSSARTRRPTKPPHSRHPPKERSK